MWEGKIAQTYVREWTSEENKANIVLIHGVGEHSGRYIDTAQSFFERGFNVYTGDLVGHGLSDGFRIYIESIKDYMDNVDFFLGRVKNDKPTFLLGHSMGGMIVLFYMLFMKNDRVKGVIASSPYIKDKIKVSRIKYNIGKVAAALFPKLTLDSGLNGNMVCRDKAIAEQYDNDELNCSRVTARWFIEVEKARFNLIQKQSGFTAPCLLLQAGEDAAVDAEGTLEFYQDSKSKDKEFILYDDFYHEILNDPEKKRVIDKISSWIDARL